ncbi:MAG: hypothetical protein GWO04_15510, partial [Actinobacteria bacterium]|nr:hypothetical protein [Actinomycetota bacterium]NIW28197.1 hypothetical protein [Actinomycetota bacterium]
MPATGSGARGLGLPEALVGTVVALLVLLAALATVERLLADLRRFDILANRQAGARLALVRMQREVANAGLAVDPDGDPRRPDEAIEVALDWALVVRGDSDGTGDEARVPERELEATGPFGRVTTGNDEVVGFVLGSPRSRDVLVFRADVAGHRRDGVVDRVRLARVARIPLAPPYTLYRVGLTRDGRPLRRALLDGVERLR